MDSIAGHYGQAGLTAAAKEGIRAAGLDWDRLTVDDLAPLDEFHIRGREATEELAALAAPRPFERVLDVGSGIGGSSRFLAQRFGCRVVGVDLTPQYCETAEALSKQVGLDGALEYRCASALAMPFDDGEFDLAWTQHVQMNIEDKVGLYRETARVLKPGGRFALHDLLAGPGGDPPFPVPWAAGPEMSFLATQQEIRSALQAAGFRIAEWRDTTNVSREWFLGKLEAAGDGPPPPLGLHLLMGPDGGLKFQNVGEALRRDCLRVAMALAVKE